MKKLLLVFTAFFAFSSSLLATDKPIDIKQLPQTAQSFINKNFTNVKVSYATIDEEFMDTEYKVVFVDGSKIEFDKKGNWKEISAKTTNVPNTAVPAAILSYITTNKPDAKILKLEKDRAGYEVSITGGLELKFDNKYKFIRYDS